MEVHSQSRATWFYTCVDVCLFVTESHYVAQAGFKLGILLLPPPRCYDYRYVSPCPDPFIDLDQREDSFSVQLPDIPKLKQSV
jgi:hypothetical protein